ncbi:MAG: glycoside hydrolase family 30 protein [Acidobacteria bacterium]|nr:glycoside hydrolase family 30 protein [Acidobacteriota bacterium]
MKILAVSILLFSLCLIGAGQTKPFSVTGKTVSIYTTARDTGQKLSPAAPQKFAEKRQPTENEISVFVMPRKSFQTFLGIGGSFTDAAAETFAKLPADKQVEFLAAYFDKDRGIGYTLGRTTIHSSDFSSASYTYIEEGDRPLKTFSLAHDEKFRIPLIRRAIEKAGGKLLLFASPWSPPAFMKSNQTMLQGGKLLPEFRQTWADYFVKYIRAIEREGIPIWGVTIQNEPMATQRWESCIFTAEEERDFLKNYLGPTFWKNGLKDKKIIIWDHNRDLITHRVAAILDDPEAAKYVWGIGFHWYETWAGGQPMFENLELVNAMYPDKKLLFTEGTVEKFDPARLQFWDNGERYGRSMINDFNNGTVGWTDWNLLLDETGGPNHAANFCFAPLHADLKKGELIYTPSYYYIGHFSKFIKPGAKRIAAAASRSRLLTTAFLNPDGKIVTIVMNESDSTVKYNYVIGTASAEIEIPARAIQTLVL